MTGVQQVTVADDEAEQRLDRWFRRRWPHVGQGRIEKMCRKGEIRVDGGRAKPATRVAPGQVVRIPPLPADDAPRPVAEPRTKVDGGDAKMLQDAVLFRDDHMIALNKPPGLAVQGGSKQRRHLGAMLEALRFGRDDDPRLVHRLDRDTSGVLVLARTGAAATALARSFRSRDMQKVYLAAVAGRPDPQAGTIRFGLVKAGGRGAERMETVHPNDIADTEGAKAAVTDYRVIESLGGRISAVALRPVTGRTHQLRAHMAALGNPIAGDGKYGGRGQENLGDGWGAGLGGALSRKLHLHAAQLHFLHPMTGKQMHLTAPLPEHMVRTWKTVGWEAKVPAEDLFADW
ncbi:MAG: RluA family pseudouridine synthase [Pseudomonadota bacterium]